MEGGSQTHQKMDRQAGMQAGRLAGWHAWTSASLHLHNSASSVNIVHITPWLELSKLMVLEMFNEGTFTSV